MNLKLDIKNPTSFAMGELVITANAESVLNEDDVAAALARHMRGDWGNVSELDGKLNDHALRDGDRLLSSYTSNGVKFWIITEHDRSVTTVLLPEDY